MYFQDLTPYELLRRSPQENLLNIGWLSREHAFRTGDTPVDFRRVLSQLATNPINLCGGHHDCEFCEPPLRKFVFWRSPDTPSASVTEGNGEIRVPAIEGDIVYVAPQLVAHYVEVHRYLPPAAFVEAVLAFERLSKQLATMRRSEWKDRFPVLDAKWAQWRLFGEGGDLLAVVPGDKLSEALDLVERNYDAGKRVEVSRAYRDPCGEGVVVDRVRHEISHIPVGHDEVSHLPRECQLVKPGTPL